MQDKLKKILEIKIDAINKNIDNLNYLNGELEKNNESLDYIKDKISLFENNDVLNFDKISKDDFEKILLMIEHDVSDIFRSNTCSYDGIIYIIEGIRKSISLELTEEQNNAILTFIEGMRMKLLNLQDIITNLNESKNRLPEIDLNILSETLEDYENITSKLENNLYIIEIDEIENAMIFAEVSLEEKADIYEYLLKYNADIYSTKENNSVKEETKEEIVELPEFHYEPFDINSNINVSEMESNENDNQQEEKMPTLEEIKINLDQMNKDFGLDENLEKTKEINILPISEEPTHQVESVNIEIPSEYEQESYEAPNTVEFDNNMEIPLEYNDSHQEENHELNTVELEDIIKKIDAKLKEMDNDNQNDVSNELTEDNIEVNNIDYSGIITKYGLPELIINGKSVEEVDSFLNVLNNSKVLNDLKQDNDLLEKILNNGSQQKFEELTTLIKENLLVKNDEFDYVLDIIFKTIPIILINEDALKTFKENLEFFKEHKLNVINIFDNYRELLIINNDLLKENYKKVEMYGLEVNNDNVKYCLYNKNILENIDLYLEAIGYEKGFLGKEEHFDGLDYIKKNPYKLNEISKNTLMKLRYSSENNKKIFGNKPGILSGEISNPKVDILTLPEDYKNTYFNGNYGFIESSEYNNLKNDIENLNEFDLTLDGNINKLDSSYKYDDLRYKIENILISRNKTIRIYNFLKNKNMSMKNALLVALTFNTVLKISEYDQIKTVVEAIVEGGN